MSDNILIGGFKGEKNTAKMLLDELKFNNKIYLENDFDVSVKQVMEALTKDKFELVVLFGQKPNIKSIYFEKSATIENNRISTNYNYESILSYFNDLGYNIKLSNNAGNYLCNNVYYYCLKNIRDKNIKTKVLFIHIPTENNIFNIEKFANEFTAFLIKNIK